MTSTTHFYLMTNINNSAVTTSALMQAASLVVLAVAPLAVGVGIAAINVPDAEARVTCRPIGTASYCR
ncbi:hypothetical protein ACLM44_12400 [Synechococcus sp. W2B2]|uniref:hypothetical protein n=1 Tax=unclassified Synechococcus TaxID=2626047 RepID=UPI0012EA8B37|nr:hypothetical protein [Synechococcus sp. WH 7805]